MGCVVSRSVSERSSTFENREFKEPSPEELSESGFTWSPESGKDTSARFKCNGCAVLVWLVAEKEHPGYWHLPGCQYSTPLIELIRKGWKKPQYWEFCDGPMGYDGINSTFLFLNEILYTASQNRRPESQTQDMLNEARSEWTYQYKPLNKEKREIRILCVPKRYMPTLSAAQDLLALVCAVRIVSLDDMPSDAKFEALSYTWGPSKPSYPLYIVDENTDLDEELPELHISPNLNSALRHIVVESEKEKLEEAPILYLWIDALCINQRDDEEKAWQVGMMYEIYQRAARVIVWLGPGNKSSNLAMEVLMGMRRVSEALKPFREKAHAEGFPDSVVDMTQIPESAVKELHPDDLELAAAFGLMFKQQVSGGDWVRPFPIDDVAALFERPYWSRVWIWQEFAAANDIVVVCGTKRAKEEHFRTFMVTWDSQTAEMVLHPRGIDGIDHRPWAIVMTRRELRLGEEIRHDLADPAIDDEQKKKLREFLAEPENQIYNRNLRMLLQEAWKAELEATNPLDHIYALLNLASDREELGIEVDYTLSPVELYRKAVRAIYTKGDLALLAYCKWDGVQTDLPSWVPHFTGQQGWIPIRELCGRGWHGTSVFDASKGKQAVIAFGECNPKILKINGIAVDTLTFLDVRRADVSVNDVTPANRRHIVHWLRQTFDYLSDIECEAYPNAKARKEAVWKTPILNHFNRGYLGQGDNHAGPEAEKGYNALLRDDMETQEPALVRLADIYFSHMMRASNRTRPFRTSKGYIGLGSTRAEEGDIVVVLLGCEVPFLLRKWGEYHYRLIGEVYVHGIMFGELFAHEPQIDTFHLC